MRRLWVVLLMAVFIASVCFFGLTNLNKYNRTMIELLENAMDAADENNFEKAENLSVQAEEEWIKAEKALSFYLDRAGLYQIGAHIAKLPYLLTNNEKGEFQALCRYIIVELTHIINEEHG